MIQVETMGAGFNRQYWDLASREEAEHFARWLSIKDADNPSFPNPYFVVADGRPVAGYFQGNRLPCQADSRDHRSLSRASGP